MSNKWEQLPDPKVVEEKLANAETWLATLADKIRHPRTQIALHYKRVWRVGFILLGLIMLPAPLYFPLGFGIVPTWVVGITLLGVLVILLGVLGPADLDDIAVIKSCKCEVCKPKKDLR